MKKILLILTFSIVSLFAYDVEKDGKYWFVYSENDIVGVYREWYDEYRAFCGNPNLSVYDNKYVDKRGLYIMDPFKTKREAQNAIIQYCEKR